MRWLHRRNHEVANVLLALFIALVVVSAVYRRPTDLFVDLAVPPAVVGILILLRAHGDDGN
jgi:hypothetical protein